MFTAKQTTASRELLELLRSQHLKIATVESCTGGLVAALLTEIEGSSDVVERGFVTYSNQAKTDLVAVPEAMIRDFGAVSEQVARAMASGALLASRADIAVAVTGMAGPGGGSVAKPVGLVHLAAARRNGPVLHLECRFGEVGRSQIRERAVAEAFVLVRRLVT